MSLESFKQSVKGAKLAGLFASEEAIRRMIQKSEAGRPAVEAIGKEVEARVGALSEDERKLVGRWAKEALAPRGWLPDRKGRVSPGNFFSRGTVYRRAGPRRAKGHGPGRLAAAQAIVARFSQPTMSSEQLIEERSRAFEAGE
ncbi:MAG: hypothetical protein ACT4N8_12040 [Sphingosinicella sp.]|uniref:hypothetical protein n=1 Tax=Sphingosinicella sp. TaxID=1917971 RepID=UPI004037E6E2